MTRRQAVLAAPAIAVSWAASTRSKARPALSMEAYIWQQYAARQNKHLADVIDEVIPMARTAGFTHVELNQEFLTAELRHRVLDLVRANQLGLPSVYVGGVLHEPEAARQTIERALEIAALCRPFGCQAIVTNPSPKPEAKQKSDEELRLQTENLNRLGRELSGRGFQLRVHHHTPELVDNAREWRYILHSTEARSVALCLDLDWAHQGGMDPLAMLREAGSRVAEVHLRNSNNKLWLEALQDGDVDYRAVAQYFQRSHTYPLLVVELAYRENTVVTRTLAEDLRLSRLYAEQVFAVTLKGAQ